MSTFTWTWNGSTLKFKRLEAGLSASSLAEAVGRTPGSIYHWESNLSQPSMKALFRLGTIFDCNPGVFFTVTETNPRRRQSRRQVQYREREKVSA